MGINLGSSMPQPSIDSNWHILCILKKCVLTLVWILSPFMTSLCENDMYLWRKSDGHIYFCKYNKGNGYPISTLEKPSLTSSLSCITYIINHVLGYSST